MREREGEMKGGGGKREGREGRGERGEKNLAQDISAVVTEYILAATCSWPP